MKRLFFAALLLLATAVGAQTKMIQAYDYLYIYTSPTAAAVATCSNDRCYTSIVTTSDTLARIHDNRIVFWKAALAAANVSDTLAATGNMGFCRITVPTTISTQRIVQVQDIAIIYQTTTYSASYAGPFYQLPITIRRNSDAAIICTIYQTGAIDWTTTPAWAWTGRIGTTRVKRITLP